MPKSFGAIIFCFYFKRDYMSFLTKIFKPNPYKSFAAEIKKLEILNEANAPAPKLVLKSDEFFVI